MIGYVTLGTNDLARSTGFYDALLAEIGAKRFMESERSVAWSVTPGATRPWAGAPGGNGVCRMGRRFGANGAETQAGGGGLRQFTGLAARARARAERRIGAAGSQAKGKPPEAAPAV